MAKRTCWRTKAVPPITLMPSYLLRILGKKDASENKGVTEAAILKVLKKEAALEKGELIRCERFLSDSRRQAAAMISMIRSGESNISSGTAEMTGTRNSMRAARRRNNEIAASCANVTAARQKLCEINQDIISTETTLHERILKLREKAGIKVAAYVSGVRSVIPDYSHNALCFDDSAIAEYEKKHSVLDRTICELVEDRREDVINESV